MEVNFTINFAYIIYPLIGIFLLFNINMLLFTSIFSYKNHQPNKNRNGFDIFKRMVFRWTAYIISIDWLIKQRSYFIILYILLLIAFLFVNL